MAYLVVACVRNRDGSGPRIGGVSRSRFIYVMIIIREEKKVMCVLGSRRCLSDRPRDCTTIYKLYPKAMLSQSPRSVILLQVCKQIAGE